MEDVLAIRDEYRLQEWSQIIQAGQNSGLSKRSLSGRLRLSLSSEQEARAIILLLLKKKNAKKNSDRVLRTYYLDRDIDKALRRMALEEGKNLTESVNNALRAGLTKYL